MSLSSGSRCDVNLHRPVLGVGQVAGTLIDLQWALARAFTLILLHSGQKKTEELRPKVFLRKVLETFLKKTAENI